MSSNLTHSSAPPVMQTTPTPAVAAGITLARADQQTTNRWIRFRSSNHFSIGLTVVSLVIGVPYFVTGFMVSKESLALSEKAYKYQLWKDCRDRSDMRNSAACEPYLNMTLTSISKRSLKAISYWLYEKGLSTDPEAVLSHKSLSFRLTVCWSLLQTLYQYSEYNYAARKAHKKTLYRRPGYDYAADRAHEVHGKNTSLLLYSGYKSCLLFSEWDFSMQSSYLCGNLFILLGYETVFARACPDKFHHTLTGFAKVLNSCLIGYTSFQLLRLLGSFLFVAYNRGLRLKTLLGVLRIILSGVGTIFGIMLAAPWHCLPGSTEAFPNELFRVVVSLTITLSTFASILQMYQTAYNAKWAVIRDWDEEDQQESPIISIPAGTYSYVRETLLALWRVRVGPQKGRSAPPSVVRKMQ